MEFRHVFRVRAHSDSPTMMEGPILIKVFTAVLRSMVLKIAFFLIYCVAMRWG